MGCTAATGERIVSEAMLWVPAFILIENMMDKDWVLEEKSGVMS